jgi:CheY-like chemotaxis protein
VLRFVPPALEGNAVLMVSPPTVEACMIKRRLTRWGAKVDRAAASLATDIIAEQRWDAVLVDHSVGTDAAATIAKAARDNVARCIVLITPGERSRLPALKDAGFTGYLVKPVRSSSLKSQLSAAPTFDSTPNTAEPETAVAAEQPAASAKPSLSVLVAEDNDINALLTRALLTRLDHHPEIAADGAAAIDCWQAAREAGKPYDLILMDVHMPGVDGLEAARRIRAIEAESGSPRTRIIALTANAFDEDREACLAAGMDGFLVKPLDRERLAAVLAEQSGKSSAAA